MKHPIDYLVFDVAIKNISLYLYISLSKYFTNNGNVTITGEGLHNLGICSALRAFEQGGIFIVPHQL
jgi:hypothetical protein